MVPSCGFSRFLCTGSAGAEGPGLLLGGGPQGGHRDRPGSGLGLPIVRSIATAHGARATAKARPEGGLVVTVGFPEL
ncbi:ATP-binding protein [Nocardiopsis valliformis]|uniref:ATP-binding protein n=1 Tax=Nocardiopsis valliformis TaxID=239974 RepID=UPI0003458C49